MNKELDILTDINTEEVAIEGQSIAHHDSANNSISVDDDEKISDTTEESLYSDMSEKTTPESGAHIVCKGAMCKCNQSVNPETKVEIKITSNQKVYVNEDKLAATIKDSDFMVPVAPFVQCKLSTKTEKPCEYKSTDWMWTSNVGSEHPEVNGNKILTENAIIRCMAQGVPGTISVVTHGQEINVADDALEDVDESIAVAIICLFEEVEVKEQNAIIPSVSSISQGETKSKNEQKKVLELPLRTNSLYEFTAEYTLNTKDALYSYWYIKPIVEKEKPIKFAPSKGLLYKQSGNKIGVKIKKEGKYYIEGFGRLTYEKNKKIENKKTLDPDCTFLLDVQSNKFKQIKIDPVPVPVEINQNEIELWSGESYEIEIETLFELTDEEKKSLSVKIEDSDHNIIKRYSSLDDNSPFVINNTTLFTLSPSNEGIYYVYISLLGEPEIKYTFTAIRNKLKKKIEAPGLPSSGLVRPMTTVNFQAKLMRDNPNSISWYIDEVKQAGENEIVFVHTFKRVKEYKVQASIFQFFSGEKKTDAYTVYVKENAVTAITTDVDGEEQIIGKTIKFSAVTIFNDILRDQREGIIWKIKSKNTSGTIEGAKLIEIKSLQAVGLFMDLSLKLGSETDTKKYLDVTFNQIGEYEISAHIGKTELCPPKKIKITYAHIEEWKFTDSKGNHRKQMGWGQEFYIYLKVKGWQNKEIALQLWYDSRRKDFNNRFKEIEAAELKGKKHKVDSNGICKVKIGPDSFWNLIDKEKDNNQPSFFFTAIVENTLCDNWKQRQYDGKKTYIFPENTDGTYACVPEKTTYRGMFADATGNILKHIIQYEDAAKVIIWIENKKGDSFKENKYHLYLYENKEGDDTACLALEQTFDDEGRIEYDIPMGYLKSQKSKSQLIHIPRFFYFELKQIKAGVLWGTNENIVYIYPESYGIGKKNDGNLFSLDREDYTAEDIKQQEEQAKEWLPMATYSFANITNIGEGGNVSNAQLSGWLAEEARLRALSPEERKKEEDKARQEKTAANKNKAGENENEGKLKSNRNYFLQLKVAEDARQQNSILERVAVKIGEGINNSSKDCGGKHCITKENYKEKGAQKLVQEINIRLAGFGGNVPSEEFTDRTEAMIRQFQRDYMGASETGKICGGLLKAVDEFCEKYTFIFSELKCKCSTKNIKTWDKLQKKNVVNNCTGWGDGSNKMGLNSIFYERPGVHRSLLFILKAMNFYLKKDKTDFSLRLINSGYRCRFHEEFLENATYNHMGTALDLHFNKGKNGRTRDISDMDWIRKEIFCKYMRAPYYPKELNAKFGWEDNKIGLEPAKFKSGKKGADTWVHVDVRSFENKYKDDTFFIKDEKEIVPQTIVKLANSLGLFTMTACIGKYKVDDQNTINSNTLFTIEDGKEALKVIYEKYGEEMATIVEKMYRCETTHLTSGQYKHCGTPGMEVAKGSENSSPYYGWSTLSSFCHSNSEFYTVGTWSAMEGKGLSGEGGNTQDTNNPKTFIKMNSVLGGMEFLVDYINRKEGNFAIWYAGNNTSNQEKYRNKLKNIKARFVDELKNAK